MRAGLVNTSLRVLTWCCVVLLAILSLLPAEEMVRTGLPGRLEHFVAYAGSAAIAMAGYGDVVKWIAPPAITSLIPMRAATAGQ